jgi:hypothetical protein
MPEMRALKQGGALASIASELQPLATVTPQETVAAGHVGTTAIPITIGWLQGACCLAWGNGQPVGAQSATAPRTGTMAAADSWRPIDRRSD